MSFANDSSLLSTDLQKTIKITTKFNVIAVQDKYADFTAVNEAMKTTPRNSNTQFIIRIKFGIYKEHVKVEFDMTLITLIRDDVFKTTITFDHSNDSGFKTLDSGTLSKNNIIY